MPNHSKVVMHFTLYIIKKSSIKSFPKQKSLEFNFKTRKAINRLNVQGNEFYNLGTENEE